MPLAHDSLQYLFETGVRKFCLRNASSRAHGKAGTTESLNRERDKFRGADKLRISGRVIQTQNIQREEGSTVPALAPRFLSRHTTSPLLPSALRIIAFRIVIISASHIRGNTAVAVKNMKKCQNGKAKFPKIPKTRRPPYNAFTNANKKKTRYGSII
jgi:hypothetical protein